MSESSGAARVWEELLARRGESEPEPRLGATRRAAELLGDPQRTYPVIHITGTNGKTSTSRMIEAILRAHGLRTGLFTSPHLESVAERIVIDGEPISDEAIEANWDDIAPYLAMVDAELTERGEEPLTHFEALTLLAFASFADAPVDVAVIEVGMGGEWDSTNIADGQVAVFTPIALDHTHRLGATIGEIAATKAGIIKPTARIVTAVQHPDAVSAIDLAARRDEARIAAEGVDFGLVSSAVAVGGQLVSVQGLAGRYDDLPLPLFGDHQGRNLALAIAAVESFLGDGAQALDADVLAEGLALVTSPGRLQIVGVEPTVILDGAHNPHGANALAEAIPRYFDFIELALVVGILADKDAHGMIEALAPLARRIHVTASHSDRALPVAELADDIEHWAPSLPDTGLPPEVLRFDDLATALAEAREWAASASGRGVLVAGSLTVVGEALTVAKREGWAI